jgi:alpha-beta hydrolase superfamily lysophospholipase
LAEHSGRYELLGNQLAEAGFGVFAPDLFGHGHSGGTRADIEEWSDYWDQIEPLVSAGTGQPTVLLGFSLGGLISVGYALSRKPQPQLVVLSAPALGGGAWWQKALAPVLGRLLPSVAIPNGWSGAQLSRDPTVGEAYFSDPLVLTKTTARLGAALFAAQEEAASRFGEWKLPTLVLHGGADTIVPPQSTVAFGELANVERRLFPKLQHEVINEPEGREILGDIVSWINDRLGP